MPFLAHSGTKFNNLDNKIAANCFTIGFGGERKSSETSALLNYLVMENVHAFYPRHIGFNLRAT
jgi:hypothetical protein